MIFKGIIGKLWFANITLVMIILFILGFFLSNLFEEFYLNQRVSQLSSQGEKVAKLITSREISDGELKNLYGIIGNFIDAKINIVDRSRLERGSGWQGWGHGMMMPFWRVREDVIKGVLNGNIVYTTAKNPMLNIETTVLTVAVPIKDGDEILGAIFLYTPIEPIEDAISSIRRYVLFGALGSIAVATLLSFFFSKILSKPLLDMNQVALAMARGDFEKRAPVISNDEIGLLGKTLNYLSSELEKNIDALSQEKDKLANILTSMTDGVITFDALGNVILINPPAIKLLENNDVMPGHNINQCCPVDSMKDTFQKVLDTKEFQYVEFILNDKVIAVRMAPLKNPEGEVRGVVAVFQDITREKKLEELRREFVGNVSHELRTPLSLMQGYTEALIDGMADDEVQKEKYLNIIYDETIRLRKLVNDLLHLSQMETGHLTLRKDTISLINLAKRVIKKFEPMAHEKGIELKLNFTEDLPPVIADEDRLQQVFFNLIDNALRYTDRGGEIRVSLDLDGKFVKMCFTDTGIGISPEELPLIWERFHKADKARTRGEGGTGLGLAIVKNIIKAHGGSVSAVSIPGEGTTFTLTIPVEDAN